MQWAAWSYSGLQLPLSVASLLVDYVGLLKAQDTYPLEGRSLLGCTGNKSLGSSGKSASVSCSLSD
jgi:hypothetical protein